MGVPISIRLDDDVRDELEAQARARGIGLATLLRDVATKAAREARRARIQKASEAIGERVAASSAARAFYDEVGTPTTDAG
jgi:GNAT superfamily N-acetyltransferase